MACLLRRDPVVALAGFSPSLAEAIGTGVDGGGRETHRVPTEQLGEPRPKAPAGAPA
ncbi:hypothetical protein [Saccharopolyspora griseoalba]|uniref:Uncharacterized protein n=1 Tax=Saccharopolyspora griseoalba TaxID=1431848 RepID=A0ABW2LGT0_9PSEU